MNLRDLLNSPKAHHVSGRVVDLKVIGLNGNGDPVQVDATARFRFVDEHERGELNAKADEESAKLYAGRAIPADQTLNARNYYVLHAALRDAEAPSKPFAESPLALKRALVFDEARRVVGEFNRWLEEEFPERVDADDMAKLIEEAKKNLLPDLLKSYGYKRTLSVLRSLAESGEYPTPT